MKAKPIEVTVRPESIFSILNISEKEKEKKDGAEKGINIILPFLIYLKSGDCLVTATAKFHKIAHDLIQIEHIQNIGEHITDELVGKKIIKFPF